MDFNVREYGNFIDGLSDSTLQLLLETAASQDLV